MEKGRIAVPSNEKGGIDGQRSGHFGHCDVFTVIDVENGEIKNVSTIQNQDHVQGGCMVPVKLLAENQVNALIVGGIGMRPLMGFRQAGIDVYHEDARLDIRPVVQDLIDGKLLKISDNQVCGGGGGNCGGH
jgi:predicted Fe-Mo cluster-binding NifX family protein